MISDKPIRVRTSAGDLVIVDEPTLDEAMQRWLEAEAHRWADEVLKGEPGGTTPRGILGRSPLSGGMAGSPNRAARRRRRR